MRIRRDQWGLPCIEAEREEDGFFGLGYAQAEDRLEQILIAQLAASGRMASVFGAQHLDADISARRFRHAEVCAAALERIDPQVRRDQAAFLAGVRRYLLDRPDEVPAWAPPLEEWLPIAATRVPLWSYAVGDALTALVAAGVTPQLGAVPSSASGRASNEWILLPSRTADGETYVLSDPHGDIETFQMFEFVLRAGPIHCAGFTSAGAVFPFLGHTRDVAWGMTTGAPLVSDCYRLTDGDHEITSRREVIEVVGAGQVEVVIDEVRLNGLRSAIVARAEGCAYAVCTPYTDEPASLDEQLRAWLLAADVGEFKAAMRPLAQFAQNVMAADRHGGAWYVRAGRTPRRAPGVNPRLPVDAGSDTEWLGIHPLEDLIQTSDTTQGFLQNCNIAPDTMLPGGLPAARDYLFNDRPGRSNSRGRRVTDLLSAASEATEADALAIALDCVMPDHRLWLDALGAAAPPGGPFIDSLTSFDGQAVPNSVPALHYHLWREALGAGEPDKVVGICRAVMAGETLDAEQSRSLVVAAEAAEKGLIGSHGRLGVAYGEVFRIGTSEQSAPGAGGMILGLKPSANTDAALVSEFVEAPLRVMWFGEAQPDGRRYAAIGGRSLRLTRLGDRAWSHSVVLFGQSSRPGSAHRYDQQVLASEGRARRLPFEADEIEAAAVRAIELDAGALAGAD